MNKLKMAAVAAGVLAAMTLSQGCALFLVGGAAAGGYSYVKNTLHMTQDVSLDSAWDAANYAFKQEGLTATESRKDASSGKLSARNAQGQEVVIEVIRKTDRTTEIQISVGTFDTQANRAGAQRLYDRMKQRL